MLVVGLLVLGVPVPADRRRVRLSFNRPSNRLSYDFHEWTLDYWLNPSAPAGHRAPRCGVSVGSAAWPPLVATVLGTLMAFALARHRFRGRATTNVLIFLPMATPEVVMGSSLLALFVTLRVPLGFWTVVIAHIMFCVSFVVVTVKARLAGLDPRLQEAAMDLYANEWQTFRRVTLPLVLPGIAAAAMLSLSLSFDDFIITNFNSGTTVTFPMYVWGAAQRGIPPQVNVIGTAMFLLAFVLVVVVQLRGRDERRESYEGAADRGGGGRLGGGGHRRTPEVLRVLRGRRLLGRAGAGLRRGLPVLGRDRGRVVVRTRSPSCAGRTGSRTCSTPSTRVSCCRSSTGRWRPTPTTWTWRCHCPNRTRRSRTRAPA